eukprot:592172_1
MTYSLNIVWIIFCIQIMVLREISSDDTSDPIASSSNVNQMEINTLDDNGQCEVLTYFMGSNLQIVTEHTNIMDEIPWDCCDAAYEQPLTQCNDEVSALQQSLHNSEKELESSHNALLDCNRTMHELSMKHDRYMYGQLDAQLKSSHEEKEMLQKHNQQQAEDIIELNRQNAVYDSKQTINEQSIERLQNTIASNTDQIRKQSEQITELRVKNAQYIANHQRYEERGKQFDLLLRSYSLHKNAQLQHTLDQLNTSLTQCSGSLRDTKVKIGKLEHELGECNVEWGSCDQEYAMCKAAVTKLQSDIEQKQKKFSLCSKVSKDCKKDRKEMKNEFKGVRKELLECKEKMSYTVEEILNKHCWVAMEYKEYVTIGCALCIFVMGGILWMGVSINVLKAQKAEYDDYKRKMEKKEKEKEKEIQELKTQLTEGKGENIKGNNKQNDFNGTSNQDDTANEE